DTINVGNLARIQNATGHVTNLVVREWRGLEGPTVGLRIVFIGRRHFRAERVARSAAHGVEASVGRKINAGSSNQVGRQVGSHRPGSSRSPVQELGGGEQYGNGNCAEPPESKFGIFHVSVFVR